MKVVAAAASGALALILASPTMLAWRGRVMFKLGLRPIPRRPAQSALIVLGLMLASLIITAAFVVGDTLAHTLRSPRSPTSSSVGSPRTAGPPRRCARRPPGGAGICRPICSRWPTACKPARYHRRRAACWPTRR